MTVTEYISHHPVIAFCVGVVHIAATVALNELSVPLFIMQCFQIGAWSITILVGLITTVSWTHRVYKKYFKK
jgi:hypothetical protein